MSQPWETGKQLAASGHNSAGGRNLSRPDRSLWLLEPISTRFASDPLDAQPGFSDSDLAGPILHLNSRANENPRRPNQPNRPRPCADRREAARKLFTVLGGEGLMTALSGGG